MIIELALSGMLQCTLVHQQLVREKLNCFYTCTDTTKEFASTLKQYRCPKVLYADRPGLPFKDQDRKGNKWTKAQIEKYKD